MADNPVPRRAFLGLLAAATVHQGRGSARAASPMSVVASFTILADLARVVGGPLVRVASLVGANGDTHAYQARPSDARAVAAARVMITNGLGLEGWVERLTRSAGFSGVAVVASAGVQALHAGRGHGEPGVDPHAWQDVANTKLYVANIRDGLAKADPGNTAQYTAAATAYLAELERLDAEIRGAWAGVPLASRRIVTSHDAFTYYGHAYGVDFFAPQGIATGSDPAPRELAALITQIRTQNIRALFVESLASPLVIQQLAQETGVRIGPPVFSDALSEPSGPAASYLEMMRHNTRSFVAAVG